MAKYDVAQPDEWFFVPRKGFRHGCCSCGLIHDVEFKIVNNKIYTRWKTHERATAASRRWFNFDPKVSDDD